MEHLEQSLREGQYLSIDSPRDYETTIKRSRFIASLRRVSNRREFDEAHKDITLKYPKATHYCWAYRFAETPILEHSSDAGEPTGSAGRPILGALKKFSLLNVMAVVTRYYGGVKLGVPGLISAYGETALKAIQSAQICVLEPMSRVHFLSSYDLYNIFLDAIKKYNVVSSNMTTCFEENISGEFDIPLYDVTSLVVELKELSHRAGTFEYSIVNPE